MRRAVSYLLDERAAVINDSSYDEEKS